MRAPTNRFKADLRDGRVLLGLFLNTGSATVAEIAGGAGFDWCLIDAEHGPFAPAEIPDQLRAITCAGNTQAVVRVPCADPWVIKQVLDLGVQNLMIPMIDTVAEAQAAVAATRYPPHGIRGVGAGVARASRWGALGHYAETADAEIGVILQAESRAALANIDAIAHVDGVDAVFIGPADLAADLGHIGHPSHPDVLAAIEAAIPRIRAAGVAVGIITSDPVQRDRYEALGLNLLALGSDAVILRRLLDDMTGAER